MDLRKLLVGLIVVATVVFGIAVAFERSDADVHATSTEPHTEEGGGEETHTDESGEGGEEGVTSESSESATDEGTILGVNPEATPIVVLVVLASLALAAAIWLRPGWRWLLLVAAVGMLIFAVLDVREATHQFNEANTGLGISALFVAGLHAAAGLIALLLLRQPTEGAVTAG